MYGKRSSSGSYANIKNGKIMVYAGQGNPQREEDYMEGVITSISLKTEQYEGKEYESIIFDMTDGNSTAQLKTYFDSGYARGVLNSLPNADLSKPVRISPSNKDDKSTCFVSQSGSPVKWAFTKDNPNGMPQLKKVRFNGKDQWDKTDQIEFYKKLIDKLNSKLTKPAVADIQHASDDLPF